jgi:hypothetical protein
MPPKKRRATIDDDDEIRVYVRFEKKQNVTKEVCVVLSKNGQMVNPVPLVESRIV